MGSTMLQLVQQATSELGVPVPTYVVGNTNQDVIQINALMNAVGYELLRKADWQQLVKQNIFTTTYAQSNGITNTSSPYTIYGLDSSVASVDTNYQVVGTGISNATYVTAITAASSGYMVTLNQPITQNSGSVTAITSVLFTNTNTQLYDYSFGSYPSTFFNVGDYIYSSGAGGGIVLPGTVITSIEYYNDGGGDFYIYYNLSQPIQNYVYDNPVGIIYQQTPATFSFQKVKYAMPSDYDATIPRTHWDKSKRWEMLGPEDAQQWEWLLSGYISTGPRIRWRIFQGKFQIWPGTSTNELLGFEYRSKGWAESAEGTVKNSFTADTDTCIYPDRLMVLGTKLKYFEAKGFDTTAMYRDYLTELETCIAQNTSAANLSFAPRPGTVLIGYDNIPDSGYGN
jgi:hypothetical protein